MTCQIHSEPIFYFFNEVFHRSSIAIEFEDHFRTKRHIRDKNENVGTISPLGLTTFTTTRRAFFQLLA